MAAAIQQLLSYRWERPQPPFVQSHADSLGLDSDDPIGQFESSGQSVGLVMIQWSNKVEVQRFANSSTQWWSRGEKAVLSSLRPSDTKQ